MHHPRRVCETRSTASYLLNQTGQGTRLNAQELRNAEFFGEFKSAVYTLAYEQLERWRNWGIYKPNQIARMLEVEMTSDLLVLIKSGISGQSKASLDNFYRANDDDFANGKEISRHFQITMDSIEYASDMNFHAGSFQDSLYSTHFSRSSMTCSLA